MSHWFTAKTEMDDLQLLIDAAKLMKITTELNANGRGYAGTKKGDVVLKLDGPYDVIANKRDGKIVLDTDWYKGSVAKQVGKDFTKLKDYYSAAKVKRLAKNAGKSARIRENAKGQLQVRIGG